LNKNVEYIKQDCLRDAYCACSDKEFYGLIAEEFGTDIDLCDNSVRNKFMSKIGHNTYSKVFNKHWDNFLKPCVIFGDADFHLCYECLEELAEHVKGKN